MKTKIFIDGCYDFWGNEYFDDITKYIQVSYDKNNILKLYINTADNLLTVPLVNEDVLIGNEVVKNNIIKFRKNVVITKEKSNQ